MTLCSRNINYSLMCKKAYISDLFSLVNELLSTKQIIGLLVVAMTMNIFK